MGSEAKKPGLLQEVQLVAPIESDTNPVGHTLHVSLPYSSWYVPKSNNKQNHIICNSIIM